MILPSYITGLLYPEMKAARARTHLHELKRLSDEFRKDPYTITKEDYPNRGQHCIRYTVNRIDALIVVHIGEFAYSLRSGLDNLAWQLGLLSGRTPKRSSSFPIHSSDTVKDRERLMRATWDIPCEAVDVIKSLQPHLRGKDLKSDPLWRLNKLCNIDKHMIVATSHTLVKLNVIRDNVFWRSLDDTQDVEVFIPITDKDLPHVEVPPPDLIFGKPIDAPGPNFWLTYDDIAAIERYVSSDVLPRFERFFPGCPTFRSIIRG